ncbi:MAG: HAD family hydrolase [Proteobacteria bacterium]|nr:MAG: HAD family hydrolase [Pseudomonadota bacterium]
MNAKWRVELSRRDCWIFDMDGTLTHAVHDFDDIRRRLSLPPGKPILESIAALPANEAAGMHDQLFEIELELAERATAQQGARDLLEQLREGERRLGILTRNSETLAHVTLRACGLDTYFDAAFVVGRERCAPKPDPAGVLLLKELWQARTDQMVMVGDFVFDLQAGRGAGAMTVHYNNRRDAGWPEHSDVAVTEFSDLLDVIQS